MMMVNERRIRTFPNNYNFNPGELDPLFFGEERALVTTMLNEINSNLEATNKAIRDNMASGCTICLYILLFTILCPLCFIVIILEVRRAKRVADIVQQARIKIREIIDKYNPKLQEKGLTCSYGEETDIYSSGYVMTNNMNNIHPYDNFGNRQGYQNVQYHHGRRPHSVQVPYISFIRTIPMQGNMQQNFQGNMPPQNYQYNVPIQNFQGNIPNQNFQGNGVTQNYQYNVPPQNFQGPPQNMQGYAPENNQQTNLDVNKDKI
jgi:hypothetical protein